MQTHQTKHICRHTKLNIFADTPNQTYLQTRQLDIQLGGQIRKKRLSGLGSRETSRNINRLTDSTKPNGKDGTTIYSLKEQEKYNYKNNKKYK